MRFVKASEPIKGSHRDTLVVRFAGKTRVIENRHGEYWVWHTDHDKELRLSGYQWKELQYLDESIPASIEDEAEASALKDNELCKKGNHSFECSCHAHEAGYITAARQYMDTIEKLRAENERMRRALEGIRNKFNSAEVNDDPGQLIFEMGEIATEALK